MPTQSTKGLINVAEPQHVTVHSYNECTTEAEIGIAVGQLGAAPPLTIICRSL